MATILSGEQLAAEKLQEVKKAAAARQLKLAVVQVGENKASRTYITEKKKTAGRLGIGFEVFRFPETVSQDLLEQEIERIGRDQRVTGMLVQLPLPEHLKTQRALDRIPLEKDVDVLSSAGFKRFQEDAAALVPPTVCAIARLLEEYALSQKVDGRQLFVTGKRVVIVGRGRLVGLPLSLWFRQQGVEPVLVDKETPDIPGATRQADILISATGQAGLIMGDMVKEGALVIDAGTSVEGGQTKGDVDFAGVSQVARYLTPVPGGVGPLTIACLLENLVKLGK